VICERLDLGVDIARLRDEIDRIAVEHPPTWRVELGYGGWSILSASGRTDDGWQAGQEYGHEDESGRFVFDWDAAIAGGFKPDCMHTEPTPIHSGYLGEVMARLYGMGLVCYRARICIMRRHGSLRWHRDGSEGTYCARINIPIVTNETCFLENGSGRMHLAADGSGYLIDVSRPHRAVNGTRDRRIHLVTNVIDVRGVTSLPAQPSAMEAFHAERAEFLARLNPAGPLSDRP
jgi:hypothetical protein